MEKIFRGENGSEKKQLKNKNEQKILIVEENKSMSRRCIFSFYFFLFLSLFFICSVNVHIPHRDGIANAFVFRIRYYRQPQENSDILLMH